jgi:hypothetical protein
MAPLRRSHQDMSHHHPQIRKVGKGTWVWECSCGGASRRADCDAGPTIGARLEAIDSIARDWGMHPQAGAGSMGRPGITGTTGVVRPGPPTAGVRPARATRRVRLHHT